MPERLDRCVRQLVADPDFKPREKGQSKRSAAYAVCTSALKKAAGRRLARRRRRKHGS